VKLKILFCIIFIQWGASFTLGQPNYQSINANFQKKISESYQVNFGNFGKLPFFENNEMRKKIIQLEKEGKISELTNQLEQYIQQFGIENFKNQKDMIWKLAQLLEKQNDISKAKFYYGLLIRNSNLGIDSLVKQYYDDLNKGSEDRYVPIKYYYELVDYRKKVDTLRPPRGVFENMGDSINTTYEEYGPSISQDDAALFFSSKRDYMGNSGNQDIYNEDLYISLKGEDGQFQQAIKIWGINSIHNEGSPCLSPDGNTLLFVRCNDKDGMGECDLYRAERIDDTTFGKVKNLGPNINSPFWESQPCLSRTGDTLFFTSNRPGGLGGTDLFFSVKDKRGNWLPARNLGPMINTMNDEMSPFFHPEYDVLYFSSTGEIVNFGGFDIYKSYLHEGKFSEPKNIGPLVNGTGDEHYFTIDSKSRNLFYARSDENKNLDLFSFPLPMEAQPTATTEFSGVLKDSVTGKTYQGIVSVIDLENGIEVAPKFVREDGTFSFDLIDNQKYLLIIQGEDFFRIEKEFKLQGDTVIEVKAQGIKSYRIQFSTIEFTNNSFEILEEMKPDLDKLVDYLLDNPTLSLTISGHTDSKGNPEKNQQLSQKRAESIRDYLITSGDIDPERIKAIGYGSSKPIKKVEVTDEDRKLNRRVEFEIDRGEAAPIEDTNLEELKDEQKKED
jgi:outer membrane protein OmpA-like peptidoglycan-associated protein/Tol biopolymer transport system component